MAEPILNAAGQTIGWAITDDEARQAIEQSGGTVADDKTAEAVDIIAHHLAAKIIDAEIYDRWDEYDKIGEHDWEAINTRVSEIAKAMRPNDAGYEAAYEYLGRSAEHDGAV